MDDSQPAFRAPRHPSRIAADDNVWRYYTLTLWPDLFGGTTLVRKWGRIGQDGTVMRQQFTHDAAGARRFRPGNLPAPPDAAPLLPTSAGVTVTSRSQNSPGFES